MAIPKLTIVEFAEYTLGTKLSDAQKLLLNLDRKTIVFNPGRNVGKSILVKAMSEYYAYCEEYNREHPPETLVSLIGLFGVYGKAT